LELKVTYVGIKQKWLIVKSESRKKKLSPEVRWQT